MRVNQVKKENKDNFKTKKKLIKEHIRIRASVTLKVENNLNKLSLKIKIIPH